MNTYRVFFKSDDHFIVGRDDFIAPDDRIAVQVAHALRDACADCCASFEVWHGTRRVDGPPKDIRIPEDALDKRTELIVLEREIAIRDSEWAIAGSRRLIERTQRLIERTRSHAS